MVSICGQTIVFMLVIGSTIKFMVKVFISGRMEGYLMETGPTII